MDAIGVAILREMGVQPHGASPRPPSILKAPAVAKRLGLHLERVADRIAKLQESKVLLGYDVYPNYRHLNLDVGCYDLRSKDDVAATRAIEDATRIEGIAGAHASSAERSTRALAAPRARMRIARSRSSRRSQELRDGSEVGVSGKTVARQVDWQAAEGLALAQPTLRQSGSSAVVS